MRFVDELDCQSEQILRVEDQGEALVRPAALGNRPGLAHRVGDRLQGRMRPGRAAAVIGDGGGAGRDRPIGVDPGDADGDGSALTLRSLAGIPALPRPCRGPRLAGPWTGPAAAAPEGPGPDTAPAGIRRDRGRRARRRRQRPCGAAARAAPGRRPSGSGPARRRADHEQRQLRFAPAVSAAAIGADGWWSMADPAVPRNGSLCVATCNLSPHGRDGC